MEVLKGLEVSRFYVNPYLFSKRSQHFKYKTIDTILLPLLRIAIQLLSYC